MATTVGQHGVAAFTNPSNGDPLDATVVKANDNTIRDAYVAHDSDPGIHVQSSTLTLRPAAGTAGRKWMTSDAGVVRLWLDNGSTWEEISYIPIGGSASIAGDLSVDGNLTVGGNVDLGNASGDVTRINGVVGTNLTPSPTATHNLGATGNRWANGYFSSNVLIGSGVTVTGSAGDVTAVTFTGSGQYLTNIPSSSITAGTFGTGNYTIPGTLTVNSTTTLSGNTSVTGTLSVSSTLSTSSNFNATSGTITGQTVLASGGQMRAARITQSGAGGTVSFGTANHVRHTMTGDGTLTLSGGVSGGVYTLEVLQDSTGGRALTWGSGIVWPNGVEPSKTTTANRKDVYTFFYDGTNYLGQQFGLNFTSTG